MAQALYKTYGDRRPCGAVGSLLLVFGNSVKGCNSAFEGQLCDGIWENLTVGKIEFFTDFGNTWKEWYLIEDIIKNEN